MMTNRAPATASQPMDLVWAVSGRGMLLRAILAASDAQLLHARVVGVVTDRACPIEPIAAARGIPVTRVEPPGVDRLRFDQEMAEAFLRSDAYWAGLTFNRLIGPEVIQSMSGRILNVHFALLPLFTGFSPIRQAIASGMRVAGVTVHMVDARMDGGAIIGQAVRGLTPADTEESLGRRIFATSVPLVLQIVRALTNGRLSLDENNAPVWLPDQEREVPRDGFPSIDPDLAAFGQAFCAGLR